MAKNCFRCGKDLSFRNSFIWEKKPVCRDCLEVLNKGEKGEEVKPKEYKVKSITIPYKRKIKFPMICPCCLKQCTGKDEVFIISTVTGSASERKVKRFNIPTCTFCQKHWKQSNRYNRISRWLFGVSIILVIGLLINTSSTIRNSGFGAAVLVVLIGLAIIYGIIALIKLPFRPKTINIPGHLDKMLEPVMAEYGVEGKKEFIKFSFGNDEYYQRFREINSL